LAYKLKQIAFGEAEKSEAELAFKKGLSGCMKVQTVWGTCVDPRTFCTREFDKFQKKSYLAIISD
jgi:hypothetical protein